VKIHKEAILKAVNEYILTQQMPPPPPPTRITDWSCTEPENLELMHLIRYALNGEACATVEITSLTADESDCGLDCYTISISYDGKRTGNHAKFLKCITWFLQDTVVYIDDDDEGRVNWTFKDGILTEKRDCDIIKDLHKEISELKKKIAELKKKSNLILRGKSAELNEA